MTMRQTINAQAFNIRPEFTGPRDEQAEKDLETLFRDGVVVLPGLISADQCDLLKATVKAIGGEEAKQTGRAEFGRARFEGTRTKRVYGLASKSPVFDELLLHPRILSILDRSLYPGYLLHTCQSTEIFPGEARQPSHYDDGWIREPKRPRGTSSVNTIWALDDFTEANGATYYYPGSHLWGEDRIPTESDVPKRAVMSKGSVMVFLSTLYHSGGDYPVPKDGKEGQESRMGLIFLYCQPWLRCVENWFLLTHPGDLPKLDPRLRTLMGFDLLGLVGNANGLHPMKAVDARNGTILWNRRKEVQVGSKL